MKGFYGWRIVAACMVIATVSWSLGIYGMGVYVYALATEKGFSISTVSTAVTCAFVVSASLMVVIGRLIARFGSRPIVSTGILVMALAITAMSRAQEAWHVYAAFISLGLGMACISTNTIGTTLAPWFERHQGRAMSTAMLGASVGGMIGTPLLMAGIHRFGYQATALLAGVAGMLLVLPLALFVLKKRPQDIGLLPDGAAPAAQSAPPQPAWRGRTAVATRQFRSHIIAFGLAFVVQIGFISHHVPLAVPVLGEAGAAMAVTLAAVAAFGGRLLLARYADRIDARKAGAGVLLVATVALLGMALLPGAGALMAMSILYGLTIGNITTLAPLIIRREFGAASFGVVFGMAATIHQLFMALGPSLYGILRDAFGGYAPALLLSGALNIVAAVLLVWGGKKPLAG